MVPTSCSAFEPLTWALHHAVDWQPHTPRRRLSKTSLAAWPAVQQLTLNTHAARLSRSEFRHATGSTLKQQSNTVCVANACQNGGKSKKAGIEPKLNCGGKNLRRAPTCAHCSCYTPYNKCTKPTACADSLSTNRLSPQIRHQASLYQAIRKTPPPRPLKHPLQ